MPQAMINKQARSLWISRAFLCGLALKLAASFFFASEYLTELFVPFLNWFTVSGFQNPWEHFHELGMNRMFPYPTVMLWVMSIPRALMSPVLSQDWLAVTALHLFAARLPLLAFDIILLALLARMFPFERRKVIAIYWYSPIVFFINYVHGQLDIIPTALFFAATLLLLNRRFAPAVLTLAVAAATKSHIFISLPFIFVYLYKQKTGLAKLLLYALLFAGTYLTLLAPFLASEGFRAMVFDSPEQKKLFAFAISLSPSFTLVVCPTVIALVFFKFASYKKLNREILLMFLGIVFACLVIFVPPMPGWFLWSLPFLVYFYVSNKDYSRAPFIFYNAVYLVYFGLFFERSLPRPFSDLDTELLNDLALSVTVASVAFIALWMFRLGIEKNEELRLKETPLFIGIAGDSASGKHTLFHVLRNLVGREKSIAVFGDNFHKWERDHIMWKAHTHLDPSANRLHESMETTLALKNGREVTLGRYDHQSGTFTPGTKIESNKFIFFIGLHPFYLKKMREMIPLKIFLDTDETLRRYWKIRRDVSKRGHSRQSVLEQIEHRVPDGEKHIKPQAQFADLVIRIEPAAPLDPSDTTPRTVPLRVRYLLDNSINLEKLLEHLRSSPALTCRHTQTVERQELEVEGTITAREVMAAAHELGLNFDELLIKANQWLRNHHGITQLVFLLVYNDKMGAK